LSSTEGRSAFETLVELEDWIAGPNFAAEFEELLLLRVKRAKSFEKRFDASIEFFRAGSWAFRWLLQSSYFFLDSEPFGKFPYAGQQLQLFGPLIDWQDIWNFLYCALAACIGSIFEEFLALHNFENFSRPSKKIKRSDNFNKLKQDKKQQLSQKRNSQSPIWTKLDFCPSVWWWW
jgi:hypothetical protein